MNERNDVYATFKSWPDLAKNEAWLKRLGFLCALALEGKTLADLQPRIEVKRARA
jgi:hypothetical protein